MQNECSYRLLLLSVQEGDRCKNTCKYNKHTAGPCTHTTHAHMNMQVLRSPVNKWRDRLLLYLNGVLITLLQVDTIIVEVTLPTLTALDPLPRRRFAYKQYIPVNNVQILLPVLLVHSDIGLPHMVHKVEGLAHKNLHRSVPVRPTEV